MMLRLVICCGGGMSSSVLAARFQRTIDQKQWQEKFSIAYMPLLYLEKQQGNFDIALLCPHLLHSAKQLITNENWSLPLYMIPAKLYGLMDLQPLVEDAIDILELYDQRKEKLIHFPDEKFLEVKRNTSHRRWLKQQEKNLQRL